MFQRRIRDEPKGFTGKDSSAALCGEAVSQQTTRFPKGSKKMDGTAYPDDLGPHFRTGFSRGSEPRVTIPRVKNQGTLAGTPWNIANSDSHSDSIISATPLLDLSKWAAGPRFRRNLHKSQPCPNFWNISRNLDNWPGEVTEFLEIFQKFGQGCDL